MSKGFYRFYRTQVESISALKGANSWYAITDARNELLLACHVIGSCLGGTSTFHAARENDEVLFRLEPKRKLLNLTYFVCEGDTGPRLATIVLFTTRGLKVSGPDGRELYRVVDPKTGLDKLMQAALEDACNAYVVVDAEEVIGTFDRRERPEPEGEPRKGLLRKLLNGLAKVFARDLCLELKNEGKVVEDHRPLLAAMILLMEQTISNDQAT